jgi:hypothetical protein
MQESVKAIVSQRPVVLFVHAVDTEGPISETLYDTFERLKELFGVILKPTVGNLLALQSRSIPLDGVEEDVANCFSMKRLSFIQDIGTLDVMLDDIFSKNFRNRFLDDMKRPYSFSWFCIDHVGFETNERRRLLGHGTIFKHYFHRINLAEHSIGVLDSLDWHYHGVSFGRHAHQFGLNWSFDTSHIQVLSRRLLDFGHYPSCFRAGGWIERPDMNLFLEQWIPFDFSNHSFASGSTQPDYKSGRFSNWSYARRDWCAYHPSIRDYQQEGELHRAMFRSLSIDARGGSIGEEDIELAFLQARQGFRPVLSVTNHDNRDMRPEIESVMSMVNQMRARFPDVTFLNATAQEAAMLHLHREEPASWEMDVKLQGDSLFVRSDRELFGAQPFLAFKTTDGRYFHDNFSMLSIGEWLYVFDQYTVPIRAVESIGIAAHDKLGNPTVARLSATDFLRRNS